MILFWFPLICFTKNATLEVLSCLHGISVKSGESVKTPMEASNNYAAQLNRFRHLLPLYFPALLSKRKAKCKETEITLMLLAVFCLETNYLAWSFWKQRSFEMECNKIQMCAGIQLCMRGYLVAYWQFAALLFTRPLPRRLDTNEAVTLRPAGLFV